MTCYIWYENNSGFKVTQFEGTPSLIDIAEAIPDTTVNVIELMNQRALKNKLRRCYPIDINIFVSVN